MSADWTLAIDFGTSSTVAAAQRGSEPPAIVTFEGGFQMPSAVLLDPQGQFVVGKFAVSQRRMYPDRFIATPKREMRYSEVDLGAPLATVDVVAAVLRRAASEAKRINDGRAPFRVVLTHPATWHEPRRAMLQEAAGRAGLEPVEFLAEPVAAALMYADEDGSDAPVAVYDLGAGTFDVTVLEKSREGPKVVGSPRGIDPLGGLTFDQKLFDVIAARFADEQPEQWERLSNPTNTTEFTERFALDSDIREAKEALSENNSWEIRVLGTEVLVTRDELEELILPEVERTIELTREVLESAGIEANELGALYMVGGASRVPLVKTMLYDALGVQPRTELDRKTVVALGGLRWITSQPFDHGNTPKPADGDATSSTGDPEDDDEERISSSPGRSRLGSVAALLFWSAAAIAAISLFPQFSNGAVPASNGTSRAVSCLGLCAMWVVGGAFLRSRQAVVLMIGAFFLASATLPRVGTPLAQLGSASPSAGFWLVLLSLAVAIAGVHVSFRALSEINLVGFPLSFSSNVETTATRIGVFGIVSVTVLLVVSFLVPWSGSSAVSRTFGSSPVSAVGMSWTALMLACIPVAAVLWRPTLAGMASMTGFIVSQGNIVVASATFHAGNLWIYLQVVALVALAGFCVALSRVRRRELQDQPESCAEAVPEVVAAG